MRKSRVGNVLMVGASASLAIASFAGGVLFLLGHAGSLDFGARPMEVVVGVTLLAGGGAMVVGIWRSGGAMVVGMWRFGRAHRTGGSLVAAGALPIAVCFWWTGIVPAVAVSVAIAGVVRSRRAARKQAQDSHILAAK
jgi:hypothetical protein